MGDVLQGSSFFVTSYKIEEFGCIVGQKATKGQRSVEGHVDDNEGKLIVLNSWKWFL